MGRAFPGTIPIWVLSEPHNKYIVFWVPHNKYIGIVFTIYYCTEIPAEKGGLAGINPGIQRQNDRK